MCEPWPGPYSCKMYAPCSASFSCGIYSYVALGRVGLSWLRPPTLCGLYWVCITIILLVSVVSLIPLRSPELCICMFWLLWAVRALADFVLLSCVVLYYTPCVCSVRALPSFVLLSYVSIRFGRSGKCVSFGSVPSSYVVCAFVLWSC